MMIRKELIIPMWVNRDDNFKLTDDMLIESGINLKNYKKEKAIHAESGLDVWILYEEKHNLSSFYSKDKIIRKEIGLDKGKLIRG